MPRSPEVENGIITTTHSLCIAVQEAGGSVDRACRMDQTLGEFIRDVAGPNRIEFIYREPKRPKEEKSDAK